MLQATAGQAGEKMGDLRNRFSSTLDSAKATYQRLEEKTIAGAKVADKTIREHPYESIGIAAGAAFGLGLLIGVLAGRDKAWTKLLTPGVAFCHPHADA